VQAHRITRSVQLVLWCGDFHGMRQQDLLRTGRGNAASQPSGQAEILNLLTCLGRDRGLTIRVVRRDLAVLVHICDRIGVYTAVGRPK
jgi:ABC-type antimicrobial peptide transport system ATPase subunit